jgi:hypothetical protein
MMAVRALAAEHGHEATKAKMRGCWNLLDEDAKRVLNPKTGSTAFTPSELAALTACRRIAPVCALIDSGS